MANLTAMELDLPTPDSNVDALSPRDVIRAYLDAVHRRDWERAFGFFAEDMLVQIPGRSEFAGEHRGRQAAIDYIGAVRDRYGDASIELDLVDVLASDQRVTLLIRERFTRDGSSVVIRRANVYRIIDGRIAELSIYEGDQYDVDERLLA